MRGHRDLEAWKSAHLVVTGIFNPAFRTTTPAYFPIYDQRRRAALSVQLNIAEGYGLQSPKAFRRHLVIAYDSAVETGELLERTLELTLGPAGAAEELLRHPHRTQRLLRGLITRYSAKP